MIGYVLKMYPRFSETFIVSEILAREAAGEELVIFSLRPPVDPRFHPELARVRAPVVYLDRPRTASRLWTQVGEGCGDPAVRTGIAAQLDELLRHGGAEAGQAVALAAAARARGVTHLHAHFASVATTVARLAGRIAGLPFSFTAHAKDIFHADVDQDELERKLRDAHHAITISRHNLEHLRDRFPGATDTLRLVHNGLELERFPFAERERHDGPPRILAIGRLVEKKGFGLLLEAAARLRDAGRPLRVDLVGGGPLEAELAAAVDRLDLAGVVTLRGPLPQDEVTGLLAGHDLMVAPFVVAADGNADGLPTVLLEAMARGLPCVAADVTGVGEVVRTGDTGWLVPSGDVGALADAIAEALDADTAPATAAARAQVEATFDSRLQARRLAALVRDPAADLEVAGPSRPAGVS